MSKQNVRTINLERRAEIGAERRSRTRTAILSAGFDLLGCAAGRSTRIEDICAAAKIARGTFYYYYPCMDAFLEALSMELAKGHAIARERAFDSMDPIERTAAATRYHLRAVYNDAKWGWAVVNTGWGRPLFVVDTSERITSTIQEGMDLGRFHLASADLGRDLLLGTSLAAKVTILRGGQSPDYPEIVSRHILMSLGMDRAEADEMVRQPLPPLRTEGLDPTFMPVLAPAESAH